MGSDAVFLEEPLTFLTVLKKYPMTFIVGSITVFLLLSFVLPKAKAKET
jgi:hypothetical protein